MKHLYIAAALYLSPNIGLAHPPILTSLQAQGVQFTILSDQELSQIKGAARITDQPMPSVTAGLKIYNVKLNHFGNEHDYRSYRIMGSEWDPHGTYEHLENGIKHKIAGDRWLADKSSGTDWNMNNATEIDYHYQAVDEKTGVPYNYGWRETSWSRPISNFSW
ncbi:hypothetical protein NUH87_11200 [Pseudomonas batumici]|uniref:hypothetical protein n=1 Tax=Pseudomonas batumici TaxID=226910 RepID=UPI0030D33E2E